MRERLLVELRGMGDDADATAIAQLPFLDAVCSEVLRLNPVAPLIGRTLQSNLTVKGRDVPAGQSVGISIIALHRRPDLYPGPDRFVPERFFQRTFGPFEYLPFGGGNRRCLGASFAVYEMKIVLARVLLAHVLRLTNRNEPRSALRNTTASPARKIEMVRVSSRVRRSTRREAPSASATGTLWGTAVWHAFGSRVDGGCPSDEAFVFASAATITLTEVSPTRVIGSFDVTIPGDDLDAGTGDAGVSHLSGTFNAPVCPLIDSGASGCF